MSTQDVAYNFTCRKPREANEWQLYCELAALRPSIVLIDVPDFASMDPSVAHTLGEIAYYPNQGSFGS